MINKYTNLYMEAQNVECGMLKQLEAGTAAVQCSAVQWLVTWITCKYWIYILCNSWAQCNNAIQGILNTLVGYHPGRAIKMTPATHSTLSVRGAG